jgi:DNA-binding IclR family transcriptional regulator
MGGFETGISTIAAPVFNDRGAVTAAVSISVPAQRIDDGALPPLVDMVKAAAAQLSERISHLPSRGGWPQKNQEKKHP